MSLTEKVENLKKNHTTAAVLGSIAVSAVLGLGLSYQTSKYDAWGRLAALSLGETYDQYKVEVRNRLTNNFMKKYDLNLDGMVTREEYRQVVEENYK